MNTQPHLRGMVVPLLEPAGGDGGMDVLLHVAQQHEHAARHQGISAACSQTASLQVSLGHSQLPQMHRDTHTPSQPQSGSEPGSLRVAVAAAQLSRRPSHYHGHSVPVNVCVIKFESVFRLLAAARAVTQHGGYSTRVDIE
eukprot:2701468-Rhodomonas_salina.1